MLAIAQTGPPRVLTLNVPLFSELRREGRHSTGTLATTVSAIVSVLKWPTATAPSNMLVAAGDVFGHCDARATFSHYVPDDDTGAYLVTNINSLKIDEIGANPNALLTFQSARKFARSPVD